MPRLSVPRAVRAALGAAALLLPTSPAHAQGAAGAAFEGLGFLPGHNLSQAFGVSSDGSVIVGESQGDLGPQAFRWEGGVMEGLGTLPGGVASSAYGTSADGAVVVGYSYDGSTSEAFRWEGGAMVGLGTLPGGQHDSFANGVSADGAVVVGIDFTQEPAGGGSESPPGSSTEAFRWMAAGGMVGLGTLPGGVESGAHGTSADGAVVVGYSYDGNTREAFRWEGGAMVGLGDLPGGAPNGSRAYGVSTDGAVVVGFGTGASGQEAFRWTAEDGMVGLGDLPGGAFSSVAYGVSGDGRIVVGQSFSASGFTAFVWTEAEGMRSLKDILAEAGVDVSGWTLREARAVSADGRVIAGWGTNPAGQTEAWRAVLGGHRWVNPAGGAYEDPANWSPASVPGPDDPVLFDLDAAYTVTGAGGGLRGGGAEQLSVAHGTVDFADFALALTAPGFDDPSLIVSFDATAKVVSGEATFVNGVVGFATNAPGDTTTTARLQVFNDGTALTGSGELVVGREGRGEAFVAAGALSVAFAQIGAGMIGEVIAGNGGAFHVEDLIELGPDPGPRPEGRLFVEAGGLVTASRVHVTVLSDRPSLVDVAGVHPGGAHSRLVVSNELRVGGLGPGHLRVRDGGEVIANAVNLTGEALETQATVAGVDAGSGRRATLFAPLINVGLDGGGQLRVSGGGLVEGGTLNVGAASAGGEDPYGVMVVEGSDAGSGLSSALRVVSPELDGACNVGIGPGAEGRLVLRAGAVATCDRVDVGLFAHGVLRVLSEPSPAPVSTLTVNDRMVLGFGFGGQGTLSLDGGLVDAAGLVGAPPGPDVVVRSGSRIEGEGRIRGLVAVEPGGFVGPGVTCSAGCRAERLAGAREGEAGGDQPGGMLLVEGAYAQGAGATLEIPLAGPDTTRQGRLRVRPLAGHPALDGAAALAGALRLAFQDGYAPRAGDAFVLLEAAAVAGAFDEVEVTGLEPGWAFELTVESDRVVVVSLTDGEPTAAEPDGPGAPAAPALHAPYPNPTASRVTLGYDVAEAGRVRLAVYDALGRVVAVLVDAERAAGRYEAVLDAGGLAAGTYLVRLTAGGAAWTRRLSLLR